ncbi:thiamine phosphate synthase [Campylobacter sp. CCUG 57310]|uniref:thiamine phosphate synthase n=1 Tax=Campylobacter sp. CCUG 57310 TaxID=2517362 RepID=UPI001564BA17|nr:thiamine phosphate synthase [Campylobacter sp. CCUG 57310]QKF92311.1 thiamine phosphate synthase (TMP-TENI domain) [Campylobacter sp. CCUG 57310]
MFELICVTNRRLSSDFLGYLSRIVSKKKPNAIILRERDLSECEYENLALEVLKITRNSETKLVLHTHLDVALRLGVKNLHLPFSEFVKFNESKNKRDLAKSANLTIGVSVHSLDEAIVAQNLGASYVIAGHIFKTKSHESAPPRGLEFLKEICANLNINTYAIGGINFKNLSLIKDVGASGACMMREFLKFGQQTAGS